MINISEKSTYSYVRIRNSLLAEKNPLIYILHNPVRFIGQ